MNAETPITPEADADAAQAAIVETIAHAGPVDSGVPFANPKRSRAKPRALPVSQTETTAAAIPAAPTHEDSIMDSSTFTAAADTTADVQDKAQAVFGDLNDRAKGAMEKGAKMIEELNAFGKGNVEAIVESSKIAARGFETIGQDAADYGRKSFEGVAAAARTMASVKSPTEFLKLQSDFMRQMFDSMVAETSKNTETMLKLAGEVAQPISNRVALAAEKMKIAA
ncbi:phasin family protein [Sphingomonas sp. CROZ-RG-20F-R02-07]|uniref:phasin family protein n=1 Tax=Sphingomonas sp. CROZ-RG-20F-R02-07 TaxID=2914832 RepID=UPI001F57A8E4